MAQSNIYSNIEFNYIISYLIIIYHYTYYLAVHFSVIKQKAFNMNMSQNSYIKKLYVKKWHI